MLVLLVALAFMAVIGVVNILAIVKGRASPAYMGMAMLACGVIGLLSLIVMVGSALLVGAMLVVATLESPQGYVLRVSAITCAVATLASLALYIWHGCRQSRCA